MLHGFCLEKIKELLCLGKLILCLLSQLPGLMLQQIRPQTPATAAHGAPCTLWKYWEERSSDRATCRRLRLQNQDAVIASLHSCLQLKSSHINRHLACKQQLPSALTEINESFPHLCSSGGSLSAVDGQKTVHLHPAASAKGSYGCSQKLLWEQGRFWLPIRAVPPWGPGTQDGSARAQLPGDTTLLEPSWWGEPVHQPVAAVGREPKCLQRPRNWVSEGHKTHAGKEPGTNILLLWIWETLPN